ncbi:hypothetical protein SDC9_115872 [bioreactor metagenome]|uniref:Uncharacterized protein n=1 Tax=bioreactor metagenome TaxID=1076179 RepID=A0A645BUL0_9ZZZZ
MLDRHILVLHFGRGFFGCLQRAVHRGGNINFVGVAAGAGHPLQLDDLCAGGTGELLAADAHFFEQLGDQPLAVLTQCPKQMALL